MCVTCLAFSALTLFSPVTEPPQPANVAPANIPGGQASLVQSMSVAQETRLAITEMLKQLPDSPETQVLRQEFQSLQARLAGVKDDSKADVIIDSGLNSLSKRVMAAPNADQLIEVLFELQESKNNQQAARLLKFPTLQSKGVHPVLLNVQAQTRSWGWLS